MKRRSKTGPYARTGKPRQTRQPLYIDQLPQEARDRILSLRNQGRTWQEIEELSESFAGRRLPMNTLHRWYDLRVEQVQKEVMAQAERARALAASFTGDVSKLPEQVFNALRDQVFLLMEAADAGSQKQFRAALTELGWLTQRARQLDIEDQRLAQKNRELELKVEQIRGKVKDLKGAAGGKKLLEPAELRKKLDEIYGITQ